MSIDGGTAGSEGVEVSEDVDVDGSAGRRFWVRKTEPREEEDCVERREESVEKNWRCMLVFAYVARIRGSAHLLVGEMSTCHGACVLC